MTPSIQQVLTQFPIGEISSVEPYGNGRIHATYHVVAEHGEYVLQKIEASFEPTLDDVEKITEHLALKKIPTSRIVRTVDKARSFPDAGSFWRLMTFIPGTTFEGNPTLEQARSAGAFVGTFHTALVDYTQPFTYRLPGYRDTQHALNHLRITDAAYASSEKYSLCHPLATEILQAASRLSEELALLPQRPLHGDLKLNNLRFDASGTRAIALIDLDTVGRYTVPLEIGDMLRSWCTTPTFEIDLAIWEAALEGYRREANFFSSDEWRLIPDGFREITLSLAARYCADAYEETYFALDPAYPSRYEQNIERTRRYLRVLDSFDLNESRIRALHH